MRSHHESQGLRHADENGGTGTRRQRIQDFRQRQPIPKTENSADLAHYFLKMGGIIPRSLKNGGTRPPSPPPMAEPLMSRLLGGGTIHCNVSLCIAAIS